MSRTNEFPKCDPIANEVRRAIRETQFSEHAGCVLCGYQNVDALRFVVRSVIELHHAVGRANDAELVVPLCANCHAVVTAGYRDAGVPLNNPSTILHIFVAAFRGLGAFLEMLGQKMAAWADWLISLIARLDVELPDWRTFQEAQS